MRRNIGGLLGSTEGAAEHRHRTPPLASHAPRGDALLRCPGLRGFAGLDDVETVCGNWLPFALRPIRPRHPYLGVGVAAEPEMQPAQLPARVAAADGHFALGLFLLAADFDPGADGVAVAAGLSEPQLDPVTRIGADIPP